MVRSAGVRKGLPRGARDDPRLESLSTGQGQAREEHGAMAEAGGIVYKYIHGFDILGAASCFARGLESCPQHFSCTVRREVYSYPGKKDHLKDVEEQKNTCWTRDQGLARGAQLTGSAGAN